MPETRVNQKCPNCGAWLPFRQTIPGRRKCDFCGVAVPQLPPVIPPTPVGTPVVSPITIAALLSFFGALLAGWLFMRASVQRTLPDDKVRAPRAPSAPVAVAPPAAVPLTPVPTPPVATPPTQHAPHSSRAHRTATTTPHSEPCHISGVEMDQMRQRHGSQIKSCFAPALKLLPAQVGLSSSWELGIDADGKVVRVRSQLHVLDYKRSLEQQAAAAFSPPSNDSEAVRCAVRALMLWDFGSYVPDLKQLKGRIPNLEMTCGLTLTLAEP